MKSVWLGGLICLFPVAGFCQYLGTGSVTSGIGSITQSNLYTCSGGRTTNQGTITANDLSIWPLPAAVNLTNSSFPASSDLYNSCVGATYSTVDEALAVLDGSDISTIDPTGEVITAFVFADNYFEMYINGIAVGKDNVPYTQFNSSIVRFRVNRPFDIALLLVDWEENLGIGTELSGGFSNHSGDGGLVAVFKDEANTIIATTNNAWKAQTFYTAPIVDLSCPNEIGQERLSGNCLIQDSNNGAAYFGLHWPRPTGWESSNLDDASWPVATVFTNAQIGVNNKPAYTNFTSIFDDPFEDASFIWSSNLVLDNEVIVRYRVEYPTQTGSIIPSNSRLEIFPNPARGTVFIGFADRRPIEQVRLFNVLGECLLREDTFGEKLDVSQLRPGLYTLFVMDGFTSSFQKIILE